MFSARLAGLAVCQAPGGAGSPLKTNDLAKSARPSARLFSLSEVGDEVGDVLGGHAEHGGAHHHGAVHFATFGDAIFRHELGLAAHAADDEDVALCEHHAVDGDAVFGDDFGAVKAVGDVLAGLQDGLGDDVGGLAKAPALEVGTKFDALVVAHLMTHDAADGEGGAVFGVAFELQHVFELDGAGDGGRGSRW